MAHSTQVFKNRGEVFNDHDLMVLYFFMLDEAKGSDGAEALLKALARWESSLRHYGPGLIRLDLDLALDDITTTRAFLAALQIVRAKLAAIENPLSGTLLNERNFVGGVVFNDYPLAPLLAAVDRLKQLVDPDGRMTAEGQSL